MKVIKIIPLLKNIEALLVTNATNYFSVTKKIHVAFHKLQNYASHFIFQELRRFHFKINVLPKKIEKNISFNIELNKVVTIDHENSLIFINSLHFLNDSLDYLVRGAGVEF